MWAVNLKEAKNLLTTGRFFRRFTPQNDGFIVFTLNLMPQTDFVESYSLCTPGTTSLATSSIWSMTSFWGVSW